MLHGEALGLLVGAIALGAVHGIEPGHGWPVAASYALDQTHKWVYGFAASVILGIGHLISSIAMVAVFFSAKAYFNLAQINDPIRVADTVTIGGPVSLVAGILLILLGIREYRHGHSHTHAHAQSHEHGQGQHHDDGPPHDHDHVDNSGHADKEHDHDHDHVAAHVHTSSGSSFGTGEDHADAHQHDATHDHSHNSARDHDQVQEHCDGSLWARVTAAVPFVGGHAHSHQQGALDEAADRGLWGIAWFAFLLGFAHEEEFEIIALCAGSNHCLELMTAYALTVIVGIVGLTMLLIAGYQHFERRVERYTPYLPAFSAAVLIIMGLGFIANLF